MKANIYIKRVFITCLLAITAMVTLAQPFASEIEKFKQQDSVNLPPKNAILFVGSSTFRMWKDIQADFPEHTIINRGFGGSTLPDLIRYTDAIIIPYQPGKVLIYCGDNDIASSDTVTAEMVRDRFKRLFEIIRNKMPGVQVLYVSIKPSPSRWQMKDRMEEANKLIKKYLKHKKNTRFIDVWKPMLGPDGNPMPDIFLNDKLHMNDKGYAIWQKVIAPYLGK